MDYYSALKRSGKILEGYFEQSRDVMHNGSKGTIRENIINKIKTHWSFKSLLSNVKHNMRDAYATNANPLFQISIE